MGEVTLFETEHVVVVIKLVCFTIVVERRDRNAELVDSCCVNFSELDIHFIVVDLCDTCDVRSGFACFDTLYIIAVGGDQVIDGAACRLCGDHGSQIVSISFRKNQECIEIGCAFRYFKAPVGELDGDVVIFCVVACSYEVVADLLDECVSSGFNFCPECILCLFIPQAEVCVVLAGFHEQYSQ